MTDGSDPRLVALLSSYERFIGRPLCTPGALFDAPFPVLAHDTRDPPILFYGNRAALELWAMTWQEFTTLPSLRTAEPEVREGRRRLLEQVRRDGFTRNYEGVRVAKDGRRFLIKGATVWNILDEEGHRLGQAATFTQHDPLPSDGG